MGRSRFLFLATLTATLAPQGASSARISSAAALRGFNDDAWKLFAWRDDEALCANQSARKLVKEEEEDLGVGRISKKSPGEVPECPLEAGASAGINNDQAGGHAGTVFKLQAGKLAKLSYAFDDVRLDGTQPSRIEAGKIEFRAYMEMWCLSRLTERRLLSKAERMAVSSGESGVPDTWGGPLEDENSELDGLLMTHRLRPFALGEKPWAPRFYGICKLPGIRPDRPRFFLVQENMLAPYEKPCQLDLKLGFATTEPENIVFGLDLLPGSFSPEDYRRQLKKFLKKGTQAVADRLSPSHETGARLAGFKIFDPYKGDDEKMDSKLFGPLTSLEKTFDTFFDKSGHSADKDTFEALTGRLLDMAAWWGKDGRNSTNSVALSALMAYECKPRPIGTLVIGDITVTSSLPLIEETKGGAVHQKKASPYVTVRSRPSMRLYPNGSVTDASSGKVGAGRNSMYRSPVLATPSFPAWSGTQFVLDFEEDVRVLEFGVWHSDYESPGEEDEIIGRIEIDLLSLSSQPRKICLELEACSECAKQKLQPPEVCLGIQKLSSATKNQKPVAAPQVKLIDYAHFYMKEETLDWPHDGVHEGLMSAIMQLDRKVHSAFGFQDDGKHMKCPLQGDRELKLSEASCRRYGELQDKRFITWQPLDSYLGKCRTCDQLLPRQKGWLGSPEQWRIYRNYRINQ